MGTEETANPSERETPTTTRAAVEPKDAFSRCFMNVPRLFKAAATTPDLVARKVFRIKTVRRDEGGDSGPPPPPEPPIELTVVAATSTPSSDANPPLKEEGHPNETSADTSSTDTTGTATPRMDPSKVPVLAVGTYHRKEAAPILAAAARLDLPAVENTGNPSNKEKNCKEPAPPLLPHPSECGQPCVSGQSQMFQNRTTNAQGPPPNRPMPRPPGPSMMASSSGADHDYTNDYEDPEEMARSRGDGFTNRLLIKTTPPPMMIPGNFNSYEMSMSQQRRSQQHHQPQHPMVPPLSDCWGVPGPDGSVLHKNADGAYYIPSGSLRTTSSTLSPASGQRYLDQPHTSSGGAPNSAYSDASTTLLKYPFNTGTQQNRRRQQVGTMNNGDPGGVPPGMQHKKKKKFDEDEGTCSGWPSKWNLLLAAALLVALFIICLLLFRAPSYVYTQPAPDATSSASSSAHRYQDMGLRALPPAISLGERVDVEFFPKSMATTELTITKPTRITFNATVGSGAQLVLLMSAGVHPSLSLHDALFPIRSDRIRDPRGPTHIVEEHGLRSRRSIIGSGASRPVEILSPRSATFEQFMLEGRHYLTFINERSRVEPISFVAEELPKATAPPAPKTSGGSGTSKEHPLAAVLICEANCNQRGECVHGKCRCAPGFTGRACEEAICPVVCSGNGVFSGGVCVCKQGFKGKECEMRHNWCEVADCNGRGRCDTADGRCRCNPGWTGEACEVRACPHPTCFDRGVCVNGTCYCVDGWRGADCSFFADSIVSAAAAAQAPSQKPRVNQAQAQAQGQAPELKDTKPKKLKSSTSTLTSPPPPTSMKKESRELSTQKPSTPEDSSCLNGHLVDDICQCSPGFHLPDCSQRLCSCVNGDCLPDGSCQCWKGWRGSECSQKKCATGCEEHGKCLPDGECQCSAGWNGENCYEDGCPNQCSSKGECVMDRRSSEWSCRCQAGSTGSDCSIPVEMHCDDGLDNDSDGLIDCDDPECCSSGACASESVCSTSASPTEVLMRMPPVFNANFAQRVGFLIMEKSVQSYTDASQFNESLTSVVRGRVVWKGSGSGSASSSEEPTIPLIGVRVSDAAHPLYGFTLTRADGYFDLVVNGARSVNLQFLRTQFQAVKKSVWVPPRQIIHVDDIVLYRQSSASTQPTTPLPARAKCSPTLRRMIPEMVLISNWQYTSDGVDPDMDSSKLVVDSRTIVESLPILGTDLRLVYDSGRSPAAPSTMLIGLLDDRVDKDLRKIHLTIRIAGRRFDRTLAPRSNLTHVFAWDKQNAYRQSESGLVPVTVQVGYEYAGCTRESERVWVTRRHQMLGATARKMWGAMWTIDAHHHLDIVNNIVEMGDGGYRLITESEPRVSTIAGVDGAKREVECTVNCDGRLEQIPLFRPTTLTYAQDGSLIIGDHNLIRRIAPNGSINTILTLGLADTSHSYYIAVSPFDGTIAISLPLHKQVWKISSLEPQDSRSNYDVLAGDGTVCASAVDSCGDGALAQNAQLIFPKGIAFDRVGNLYLADSRRIRVIDTSGHIRSIGETTPDQHPIRTCAQITKLVDLQMEWPTALSIDPSTGAVLVLDTNVVYEIDIDHDVVTIALGAPTTCDVASAPSNSSTSSSMDPRRHLIQNARDIHVASDGSIYVVESDGRRLNQVRRLSPDRSQFSILTGGRNPCSCDVAACGCDDALRDVPASQAHLNSPHAVCTAPSGDVIVADSGNAKVKKVTVRLAKYDGRSRSYEVVDAERQEKYTFNRHGQHTSTISLITGRTAFNFTYQSDSHAALLSEIRSSSGISLRMAKKNESVFDLETSLGEVTTMTLSTYDGTLEQVSRRGSTKDSTRLSYTPKRLLASRIDVATAVGFEYDEFGRARGLRRDREHWRLGEEMISMGRVNTEVTLNGRRYQQVRLGEGDLAVQGFNGDSRSGSGSTRLISLRNEGYQMTTSLGTSSLFDKTSTIPEGGGEAVISRRRTTVPAISNPQRRALTTRWDWRHVARRGEADGKDGKRRVAEINGVNMFSMEYDVARNSDTLRLGSTTDDAQALLHIDYTSSGRIRRIASAPEDSDMAEMNVTWDSSGRKSEVAWGSWKHRFAYDTANRVTEHSIDGARVPLKMVYSGAARRPTQIKLDGATWQIQYDNYERIKEVSSSSGETTSFSSVALGGDEWVLKRRTSLNSKPSLVRIDRFGKIREAATPDGMHHWLERKDQLGRTTEVLNDEETSVVTCWSAEGVPMCLRSGDLVENTTLQGHLVARKMSTLSGSSSSFTYEYDDLFRCTTIQPTIEQSVTEPIQVSYDERRGHIATINGFQWARDASTSRCQGHGMMYETSKADEHRQIVSRKVIFGDARASLKIVRDKAGRPSESVLETWSSASSGGEKMQKTSRTFDAAGQLASVEVTDQEPSSHRIQWNSDGRVEKVNDRMVEWSRGGSLKSFLDSQYVVDSTGWVSKRNATSFAYDGLGRLVKASLGSQTFRFTYDLQNRVIRIQKSSAAEIMETIHLYYAYISAPNSVSHFSRNSKISTIFYDDDQVPFAMQAEDGTRYGLLPDETRTIRVVLTENQVIRNAEPRGIFGAALSPATGPYIPLGYLGGIEIPELQVSILNGRPLDLISGRYMSISPEAVARVDFNDQFGNSIDLMALETKNQPFRLENIPEDFATWFVISGLSETLLPSAQLGLPTSAPIAHRLLSSFPRKLAPLTHLTTVIPSRLASGSSEGATSPGETQWSIEDVGFANLLIITESDKDDRVAVEPLPILSALEHEIVKKLFTDARSLDFATWGLVPARHLWRAPSSKLELSSAAFSHFTMVVNKENIELRNGKSKIVVHFAEKKDELIKRLVDELKARETIPVWRAERKRLEAGEKTWRQWTEREQRELTSKGSVAGYDIEMKTAHRSALLPSVHSWKFRKSG